jgi:hypothetical protein
VSATEELFTRMSYNIIFIYDRIIPGAIKQKKIKNDQKIKIHYMYYSLILDTTRDVSHTKILLLLDLFIRFKIQISQNYEYVNIFWAFNL